MFLIGILKIAFGLTVALMVLTVSGLLVKRLLGGAGITHWVNSGNSAAMLLYVCSSVSLALLGLSTVRPTFDAIDLIHRAAAPGLQSTVTVLLYSIVNLVLMMAVSMIAMYAAVLVFDRLTSKSEEVREIAKGNIAAAMMLGACMVVVSLLVEPGLSSTLEALLPLPELPGFTPSPT